MSGRSQPLDKRERVEPPPRPQIPLVVWVLLAFLLGATLMYLRLNSLYLEVDAANTGRQTITVRARADPRTSQFGASGEAVIIAGSEKGRRIELRYGRDKTPLELGQVAEVTGMVQPLPLEQKQQYRFNRGISAALSVQSIENIHYAHNPQGQLWQLRAHLQSQLKQLANTNNAEQPAPKPSSDGEAYGLVAGLTYGDRRALKDTPLESALQRTGLAHFLAVSGTHMALLGALLFFILRKTPLSRFWVSTITLSTCLAFVFFTGFAAGSIRSVSMLAIALIAYTLSRRVCVLSSLGIAGLGMLILDPLMAVSLGFLLSFGSVLGIVLFGRYVQQWLTCLVPVKLRHRSNALTNGLAIAIVAAVATLPLTLEAFGILPIIGPFANLVLAPALCALLVASLISHFVFVCIPPVGSLLLKLTLVYSELLGVAIKSLAHIPWASTDMSGFSNAAIAAFILGIVALWLWWPAPKRKTLLRLAVVVISIALLATFYLQLDSIYTQERYRLTGAKSITVLDVGQGDAMLVRDGDKTVLVDAGISPSILRERLIENKVQRIDTLILTHDHADHTMGAQALGASYRIQQIIIADGAESSPIFQQLSESTNAPLVTVLAGDTLKLNQLEFRFIWPQSPVTDPSANETSLAKLIVDISPDSHDIHPADIVLNSGDAEAPYLRRALLDEFAQDSLLVNGKKQPVDVLLVPHHGAKNSLDKPLAELLASPEVPQTAIISSGTGNSYGHPRPEPLEIIDDYFDKLYRTDLDGSVTIEL